ncbi:hypothetical protein G9A89_004156 [Geosiphon pyriformis]|nr:hypothetical protein G9A89_004156 [Geosiphon pyriformis]
MPLFNRAALKKKPITAIYTDAKVDGHSIKLILDNELAGSNITKQLMDQLGCQVDHTASTRIITADGTIKTPIAYQVLWTEEDHNELSPILFWNDNKKRKQKKRLIWNANQDWETNNDSNELPTWKWEETNKRKRKKKEENITKRTTTTEKITSNWKREYSQELIKKPLYIPLNCKDCGKKLSSMGAWVTLNENYWIQGKWDNKLCLTCGKQLLDKGMWNDISEQEGTCDTSCQYTILISDWVSHDKIWQMANAKVADTMPSEILKIKNNPSKPVNIVLIPNPDAFLNLEAGPEEFHEHYQNLAPTKEEQEQCLCDLIYNPPPCMIYMIPEEEPISSCTLESELTFNLNLNSNNNDDKNNGSSSTQYGNKDNNNLNSNSNPETYITLPDLTKKQELKWFSDNNKDIMPECIHDTNAGFDLRYPGKYSIKLKPHSHTHIDLKIVLEISATTIIQLASRSSLAKKGINIKREIIDAGYVENIIAMLQNDSEKAYIIDPNKKIAQAIFLLLMKVVQLVLMRNRKKLGIIAREIQGFRLMDRINVLVNMAEEEIVDKEEIISTCQSIFILSYDQYMVVIERKVKDQMQIFEAEATLCESEEIELTNLYIPAKNHNHIKIPIYNNMENVVEIPEGTIISYLTTEIKDQWPDTIPDFSQLCKYVDIISQTIYGQEEYYLLQQEQLEQMNMRNLDPLQCIQLKMLLIKKKTNIEK